MGPIGRSFLVLVVHPSHGVHGAKELIALARGDPGELSYAASSVDTPQHPITERFEPLSNVDLVPVQYKGAA